MTKILVRNMMSPKVSINNQPGEINSEMISIYILIFNTGLTEAGLQFLFLLNKIIMGKNLTTTPQYHVMKNNLMALEALQVFKHKPQAFGDETMTNYELIMQGLTTHFFPSDALQLHKRLLLWVFFKF